MPSPLWLLIQLALLPIVIAAGSGLLRFQRLPTELRYLTILSLFVLVLEVVSRLLAIRQQSNLFLMPFYTMGEYCLLVLMYRQALQSGRFSRLTPWLLAGFTAYVVFDSWLATGLTRFRPSQQVMASILLLAIVGLYFRKVLNELRVQNLLRDPMFIVSTGLFVYYLGYIQIALFSNYLLAYSPTLNRNIWAAHALLSMVLYSSYSLALWTRPEK